jgi:hypothetical protein
MYCMRPEIHAPPQHLECSIQFKDVHPISTLIPPYSHPVHRFTIPLQHVMIVVFPGKHSSLDAPAGRALFARNRSRPEGTRFPGLERSRGRV